MRRLAPIRPMLVFLANAILHMTLMARLPDLIRLIGIDEAQLGLAMTGMTIGAAAALPVLPWISARISPEVLAGLMLSAMLVVILTAPVTGFWGFALLLVAYGAIKNVLEVAQNQIARAEETRRARPIMAKSHGFWSVGTLVATGLTSLALSLGASFPTHLALLGIPLLALILPVLIANRTPPQEVTSPTGGRGMRWPDARLWLLFIISFGFMAAEQMIYAFGMFFLTEDRHLPGEVSAIIYAAFAGGMLLSRMTGDGLQMRLGAGRLFALMALLVVAGFVLMLIPGGVLATWRLAVGFFLSGMGVALQAPLVARAGLDHGGARSFATLSAMMMSLGLVLPPVFGAIAKAEGVWLGFALLIPAAVISGIAGRRL